MADISEGFDPYDAVLADLRAKRDQIDQTIRLLEALRGAPGAPAVPPSILGGQPEVADSASAFLSMSIPEAARKLLALRRRVLSSAEIASALQAGGLVMRSADPTNTIGSILTRRFHQVGDIVRTGRGVWGLAEWYPNRNFHKKAATKGEATGEEAAGEDASQKSS